MTLQYVIALAKLSNHRDDWASLQLEHPIHRPALALLALVVVSTSSLAQGSFDPAIAARLRYRYIGPVGNRVSTVVGIPGDPNTYYAGAASGGIWKTTDGGINWQPIFDNQQVSSIGALAVAKSNPNIVWAGTGEPFIRSHISIGNGVNKSEDAGRTRERRRPETGVAPLLIAADRLHPLD